MYASRLNESRVRGKVERSVANGLDPEHDMPTPEELLVRRTRRWSGRLGKAGRLVFYGSYWAFVGWYYILPIEYTLRQSSKPADGASAWSFGQVCHYLVYISVVHGPELIVAI